MEDFIAAMPKDFVVHAYSPDFDMEKRHRAGSLRSRKRNSNTLGAQVIDVRYSAGLGCTLRVDP